MQPIDVEKLSMLLAGDLPPAEAGALRRDIEARPDLQHALSQLRELEDRVGELTRASVLPEDVARAERAAMVALNPPRRALSVWLAAAALVMLAVGATLALRQEQSLWQAVPVKHATFAEAKTFSLSTASVQLLPYSTLTWLDSSTVTLQGTARVQGKLRVVQGLDGVSIDGDALISTEPEQALAHVIELTPKEDVLMQVAAASNWKPSLATFAVWVVAGMAQAFPAGETTVALVAGQSWNNKKGATPAIEVKSIRPSADKPIPPVPSAVFDEEALEIAVLNQVRRMADCMERSKLQLPQGRSMLTALVQLEVKANQVVLKEATTTARDSDAPINPLIASCVLTGLQEVKWPKPEVDAVELSLPLALEPRGSSVMVTVLREGTKHTLVSDRVERIEVPIGASAQTGDAKAKVVVVMFSQESDRCRFCVKGAEGLRELINRYQSKPVLFVYKHHPFPNDAVAQLSARALVAAHSQGRFWAYWRVAGTAKTEEEAVNLAVDLKLDVGAFRAALASESTRQAVQADLDLAEALHVVSVPSFFINGKEMVGYRPVETLAAEIDRALAVP